MPASTYFVDPKAEVREVKKNSAVQTMVDYEEVATIAHLAKSLHLSFL